MTSVGSPALDLSRPFTRADAVAASIDPALLAGSRFRRIFHGVYISSAVPEDPVIRAAAALCFHAPDAYASHLTAARIYGLPVPGPGLEHVSLLSPAGRRHRKGVLSHVARVDAAVIKVRGVRVSSVLETFTSLAQTLDLVDLVVVGDAMVKTGLVKAEELVGKASLLSGRGSAKSRRAASLVRRGVDSPMETRLRLLIVLAGFPEPVVNHALRDDAGAVLLRFDLSYPDIKLLIEYDGRQHAETSRQWRRDIERRELLDDLGYKLLAVMSADILKQPESLLARIRNALLERGAKALPRRLGTEWKIHFPTP